MLSEGEIKVPEEFARDTGSRGVQPVVSPCCRISIATVVCGAKRVRSGLHGGYLCNLRIELEISHGPVALAVSDSVQAPRNDRGQAEAPEAWALAQSPENSLRAPLAHIVCSVSCEVWQDHLEEVDRA